MNMPHVLQQIVTSVTAWEGISQAPHRFGGTEFRIGKVEVGHIHRHGMVDIPFTRTIRDQLLKEGRAVPHHLLPESGWITFYIREAADAERALWLFRLSYLHKAARRAPELAATANLEMSADLARLVLKH
jgi:hypothetical protein